METSSIERTKTQSRALKWAHKHVTVPNGDVTAHHSPFDSPDNIRRTRSLLSKSRPFSRTSKDQILKRTSSFNLKTILKECDNLGEQSKTDLCASASGAPKWQSTRSHEALKSALNDIYNLEDFEICKIGEGFFSDVFKVLNKNDGSILVLKKNKNSDFKRAMLREVELLNRLSHPNILRYEAACIHSGQVHALVEFVAGGTLEEAILDLSKEIPWDTRVSLAHDIANGMTYLNKQGYLHRDLTSKNILVKPNPDSKAKNTVIAIVADFGLATKIPKSKQSKLSQAGSPFWMSPECLKGQFYDEKTDVFSYGIILCELIARIEADPDAMPRNASFGLDIAEFSKFSQVQQCPQNLINLAFKCVQIDMMARPSFEEICEREFYLRPEVENRGKKLALNVNKNQSKSAPNSGEVKASRINISNPKESMQFWFRSETDQQIPVTEKNFR